MATIIPILIPNCFSDTIIRFPLDEEIGNEGKGLSVRTILILEVEYVNEEEEGVKRATYMTKL